MFFEICRVGIPFAYMKYLFGTMEALADQKVQKVPHAEFTLPFQKKR